MTSLPPPPIDPPAPPPSVVKPTPPKKDPIASALPSKLDTPAVATIKVDDTPSTRINSVGSGGDTHPPLPVPLPIRNSTPSSPSKAVSPITVGGTPTAAVTLNAPTVRSTQPDVVVYTEASYTAKATDNYQSISLANYGDAKYAKALLQFNLSHPLADENAPADGTLKSTKRSTFRRRTYSTSVIRI